MNKFILFLAALAFGTHFYFSKEKNISTVINSKQDKTIIKVKKSITLKPKIHKISVPEYHVQFVEEVSQVNETIQEPIEEMVEPVEPDIYAQDKYDNEVTNQLDQEQPHIERALAIEDNSFEPIENPEGYDGEVGEFGE